MSYSMMKNLGKAGCIRKYDGSNYTNFKNILCEKDGYKDGYNNLTGFALIAVKVLDII